MFKKVFSGLALLLIIATLAGCTGTEAPAGPQGPVGPTGLTGAVGIQGPAGASGISIRTAVVNSNSHLILTMSDNSQVDAGIVAGPIGPAGVAGVAGLQGPTGATGPQGSQGPVGLSGTNGTNGINGTNGTPGSNAYLTAVSANTVSGIVTVAGTYRIIVNLYGTTVGSTNFISPTNCITTLGYVFMSPSTTSTISGTASFTSGSNLVPITGTWSASQTTINDGTTTYTVLGQIGTTLILSSNATATISRAYIYTTTVPSNQINEVVVLAPLTGTTWTVGQAFSFTTQISVGAATISTAP